MLDTVPGPQQYVQATASCYMPADADWHDALRFQEKQERESSTTDGAMAAVD